MRARRLVVPFLLSLCGPAAAQDNSIYIEFLWSRTPADALARQQTRQFVMTGDHEHQICVAATAATGDVGGLQLELRDADGTPVSLQRHDDYRGAKRCYRADLGSGRDDPSAHPRRDRRLGPRALTPRAGIGAQRRTFTLEHLRRVDPRTEPVGEVTYDRSTFSIDLHRAGRPTARLKVTYDRRTTSR